MKKGKNDKHAAIISLVGTKGGGGKTTQSINLAAAFAEDDYRTLLIDTDVLGSSMSWESRREYLNPKLTVIAAPKSKSLSTIIDSYSREYEIIVIDGSPRPNEDIITVSIAVADLVIIPVQPSSLDLWKIVESVIDEIKEDLPIIKKKTGQEPHIYFSVSRLKKGSRIASEIFQTLEESFSFPVLKTAYGDRVAFFDSLGSGVTVLQWDNRVAKQEVQAHYREVKSILDL